MTRKHFVLFSGGLDSAVLLYDLVSNAPLGWRAGEEVEAIGFDYGQRHAKELNYARAFVDQLRMVSYHRMQIPAELLAGHMLTSDKQLPETTYGELPKGMSPTFVPFRNGLMLSMLTARAQSWAMQDDKRIAIVYIGAHDEDAENGAYPDCTPRFMGAMGEAIEVATEDAVMLKTPLLYLRKKDIIQKGMELGVPFENTWSCYKGGEKHCGKCMTCNARKAGFQAAGYEDPTQYEG